MPPKDQAAVREEIEGVGAGGKLGFGSGSWCGDLEGEVGVVWGSEGSGSSSEKTDLKKFMAERMEEGEGRGGGFAEEFWRSAGVTEFRIDALSSYV